MASAVQGFVQMGVNAVVAGAAVPLFSRSVMGLAMGQALFVGVALLLWGIALQLGSRSVPQTLLTSPQPLRSTRHSLPSRRKLAWKEVTSKPK